MYFLLTMLKMIFLSLLFVLQKMETWLMMESDGIALKTFRTS